MVNKVNDLHPPSHYINPSLKIGTVQNIPRFNPQHLTGKRHAMGAGLLQD
jgi:hypothetical protein